MPLLISGQVGPQVISDGVGTQPLRQEKTGALVVQELHGRYFETSYRKAGFYVATQALVTTSVGLTATHTGLALSNPVGSGILLAINKISMGQTTINTAVNQFGLAVGYNGATNVTHTTPVTPRSTYFGVGAAPVALADVSSTLPTAPFYYMFLAITPGATTNPNIGQTDLEGSLIIPPGGYLVTATQAASTAGFWASFQWEEVPQ